MRMSNDIFDWLLYCDPSIRWQVMKDLMNTDEEKYENERKRISSTGWGKQILSYQDSNGLWSGSLYVHKWVSATYIMLLLRRFGLPPDNKQVIKSCEILLDKGLYHDGGINYFPTRIHSETCVTGMILSILSYFKYIDERLNTIATHLLEQQMSDGGWNCESYKGSKHSSFHTTISVLEGLREYEKLNTPLKIQIRNSQKLGREFLLEHKLFRSHRTGEIVDKRMTRFSFPPRWRYDIMRALDYFQECGADTDERIEDAIEIIKKKRTNDGKWKLQNRHPGKTYFEMEEVGKPSRWNTLRARRILKWYNISSSS